VALGGKGLSRQAIRAETVALELLGAWRHVSPARRSRSRQRLAVRVPRQAILLQQPWVADSVCVIYKASRIS